MAIYSILKFLHKLITHIHLYWHQTMNCEGSVEKNNTYTKTILEKYNNPIYIWVTIK